MTNMESQIGYFVYRTSKQYLNALLAHAAPMLATSQKAVLVVGNERLANLGRTVLAQAGHTNIEVRVALPVQPRRQAWHKPKSLYHA